MYTWPRSKSFSSSYACKAVTTKYSGKVYNVLVAPIWNLFPLANNLAPFLFSVGLLALIFSLNYYLLPIGFWNSDDGQYLDFTRCLLFSLLVYYILSAIITALLVKSGCDDLISLAREYINS